MNAFRVRVFLTESYYTDMVLNADNWIVAQFLGMGQSPIGKAIFLGEA